jgi:hypothetical protein
VAAAGARADAGTAGSTTAKRQSLGVPRHAQRQPVHHPTQLTTIIPGSITELS